MAKRSSGMSKGDLRALADDIQGEIMDRNLRDAEKGMIPMGDGSPRDPVLEEINRHRSLQRVDTLSYCKRYTDRIMHFVRTPPSPRLSAMSSRPNGGRGLG